MPAPVQIADVKTKIIATLGPASESETVIERLIRAGVDVFRLNSAHGDREWHDQIARRIRGVSDRLGRPVGILQDLSGPKIRLGELPGGTMAVQVGERLRIVSVHTGKPGEISTSLPGLVDDLREGDPVLLADGSVGLKIIGKQPGVLEAEVTLGGEIRSKQGINAPGANLQLEPLTPKDLADLDALARRGVDFIGMSFVRRPEDIQQLRTELERRRISAQIVAKIEKLEALETLDAILPITDAVMVARGDLGVEIDVARVPVVQKDIIRRCGRFGVPVITATQMLESMRTSHRPTRAEATDVANAIFDGTDAVMLSAETATGLYPVEAVTTMNRIAFETEKAIHDHIRIPPLTREGRSAPVRSAVTDEIRWITTAAVEAAGELADRVGAKLVVAATHGGHTALALSKQRNRTPTLGLSDMPETVRRMALYWGVLPVLFQEPRVAVDYPKQVAVWAVQQGLVSIGDRLVFVLGSHWADSGYHTIAVHRISA